MKPPRLSLCLIAKNEADMLPACLASVKGFVDEVILVDTGSTDGTQALASSLGAKVFEQPWEDDFARARNESLKHATGDWVLILDADERLVEGAGPAIRHAIQGAKFDCGMLRLHHASRLDCSFPEVLSGGQRLGEPFYLPRLLRHTDGLQFKGVIHECVTEWLVRRGTSVRYLEAEIVHLGSTPEVKRAKNKVQRNLDLLRKRCEQEPDNAGPFGYLALDLLNAGELEEAIQVVDRGWPLVLRKPEHQMVLRLADARGSILLRRGDAEGVLETVRLGERCEGPHPDLHFLRGCALELLAFRAAPTSPRRIPLLKSAADSLRAALAPPPRVQLAYFLDGSAGHNAQLHLGQVLLGLGQARSAVEAFEKVRASHPQVVEAQLGLAEALIDAGQADRALAVLEPLPKDLPDTWLLMAAAAEALGARADAIVLFQQVTVRAQKGLLNRYRLERHASVAAAVSIYAGQPTPEEGPIGALSTLMARAALPRSQRPLPLPDARALRILVVNVLQAGRAELLEALLEKRAEALMPGLGEALRGVLVQAGAELTDDGEPEPVFLALPGGAEGAFLHSLLQQHSRWDVRGLPPEVASQIEGGSGAALRALPVTAQKRSLWLSGAPFARLDVTRLALPKARFVSLRGGAAAEGVFTLSLAQLLEAPPLQLSRLAAFLGEPDDEALVRFAVEQYPTQRRVA